MIYKVTLNGKIYEVEVEKGEAIIQAEYDAIAPQVAPIASEPVASAPVSAPQAVPTQSVGGSANAILAPMPGNINAVKVTAGQQVKKGDVLILLEAMKMENEIVADKDGKVGQIFVQKGAVVDTGAPLIEVL